MAASEIRDFSRLAIHTMTNKPWSLAECIAGYSKAGVPGLSVWRNVVQAAGVKEAARMLRGSGLQVVSLVRGGFFPAREAAGRVKALDENRRAVDETAAVGAPLLVLVCGSVPGLPLAEARGQIAEGIAGLLPHAAAARVKLAIEPLHPMYAADRSAVVTMRQSREICERLRSEWLGMAVDVYHVWWDAELEAEIRSAGSAGLLAAFHLCDWRVETRDLLNDRGLMGEGCIDLRAIRGWMEEAGFRGWREVEVFSTERWKQDQSAYVEEIKQAYLRHA